MLEKVTLNPDIHQDIQGRLKFLQYLPNEGTNDGSYSVYSFEGHSGINEAYTFHISFVSDQAIAVEEIVDTNVELKITDVKNPLATKSVFGMVFQAKENSVVGSKYMYDVEVVSPLFYMGLGSGYEIFLDKKAPDIISEIIGRYAPLLNVKLDMRVDPAKAPAREYTTRYKQSALEFITMLCEEEGYSLIIEHTMNDPYTITLCELNDHARVHDEPLEAEFNKVKRFSSSNAVNNFYDYDKPSLDMHSEAGSSMQSSMKDNTFTSQLRHDLKNFDEKESLNLLGESLFKDLKRYTDNDALRGYADSFLIQGQSSEIEMCDAALVRLHNEKTLTQEKVITIRVHYYGKFPNALDEFIDHTEEKSIQFFTSFEAIPSDIIYKPQKSIVKPRISGTLTAIVSEGNADTTEHANEIDVDEEGRIRVLFHFEENKGTSTYLRVMQPYAGDNYGFLFLPRVNTEVLVGFKNGNPDEPVILKALPNGENKQPYPLPADKAKSFIRTTSYPAYKDHLGYNELLFDDTKESERFAMRAQRNYELYAKNDLKADIHNNKITSVHNEHDDVKHDLFQTIGNNSERTVKANDIKTVEKEEVHTIKENKAQTAQKDFTTIVAKDKRSFIEQELINEIKEVLLTYVEGDVTDKYLQNLFVQVGKDMGVDIEGALHIDTSSVKSEVADTALIDATDGISLKCGGNVLTIDSSGIYFNTPNYLDNSGNGGVAGDAVSKIQIDVKQDAQAFSFSD
ncbi:type VI secretion system tip protein TssI/VgrG [Sulfurimonas sp. HSL3-2]|uniref:type VI secretion system Vgr family protein n=1 Tax=Hydrocurvibacter mobilis TaxID=3131936 RepID=UPI0031F9A33E